MTKKAEKETKGCSGASRLTEKEKLFCALYAKCFNATTAYQRAYGCNKDTANRLGCQLVKVKKIRAEIDKLKRYRYADELLTVQDITQKFIEIAFADITDYVYIDEKGTAKLRPDLDGTMLQKISVSGSSLRVELPDRVQALTWLADHMGMLTDEQQARIEKIRAETAHIEPDESSEGGVIVLPEVLDENYMDTAT